MVYKLMTQFGCDGVGDTACSGWYRKLPNSESLHSAATGQYGKPSIIFPRHLWERDDRYHPSDLGGFFAVDSRSRNSAPAREPEHVHGIPLVKRVTETPTPRHSLPASHSQAQRKTFRTAHIRIRSQTRCLQRVR